MEHCIQIGVSVDDQAIEKAVIEAAKEKIYRSLFDNRGYITPQISPTFERIIFAQVVTFMEENREEIISKASEMLAERLSKTKGFKELVNQSDPNDII